MNTKILTEKGIIAAVLHGGGLPGIPAETLCGLDTGESRRTARYIREKIGEHTAYISGLPGYTAKISARCPRYMGEAGI